jgi:hypothetical protein
MGSTLGEAKGVTASTMGSVPQSVPQSSAVIQWNETAQGTLGL